MNPEAASHLASDLVIRYPLARRGGVRALARHIKPRGLAPDAAEAAAAILLAIELFDAGRSFGEAQATLLEEGLCESAALAAALDAARIQRSPEPPPGHSRLSLPTLVTVALASIVVALLLLG
jgi:hypothetical protein